MVLDVVDASVDTAVVVVLYTLSSVARAGVFIRLVEWNDQAYTIVNGRLPQCAHAQQTDKGLFPPKKLTAALRKGQGDRAVV